MEPRRRCLRAVAITAAGLLLAACGGGQAHSASAPAHDASGISHDVASTASSGNAPVAVLTPSRSQALSFARAVNLSVGDIPEASIEAKPFRNSDAKERREYQACERFVGWPIAEASSPKLKRGQELEIELIRSSVAVVSNDQPCVRAAHALSPATSMTSRSETLTGVA
jgi:hypothetical protein